MALPSYYVASMARKSPAVSSAKAPLAMAASPRVAIEGITPEVDGGRFPAKRAVGEMVVVEADVFAEGHDEVSCVLRYRHDGGADWIESPMSPLVNDRWRGEFMVTQLGRYQYGVQAWADDYKSWARDLSKRLEAGQDVSVDRLKGAAMVEAAARRIRSGLAARRLQEAAKAIRTGPMFSLPEVALGVMDLMQQHADRGAVATARELEVVVEPERTRFSAWYELFPRSWGPAGKHGTFKDVEARLDHVAGMGFDVLYLAPIHPIGRSQRKGRNNSLRAGPKDPGSPWAIGAREGGHKSVHPELGTLSDFKHLVQIARKRGLELALDIALQCSPDHPYLREHPEWFARRPDGSIQYAENPPKKYEDIYPFDFETEHWQELWEELLSIFLFWMEQGVRIFRVDNPHTKPLNFWEWLIAEVKHRQPDVVFLAEAFTRPKIMYRLAKLGFSQSYTYFAWRNSSWELRQYFTELTQTPVRDFFRPSLWPNTPDILTEYLQAGGRPAFIARLTLAATLGASFGIYGPAFELCENRAREQGSEEYLDSEKYQLRSWDLERTDSLRELITLVNRIRRDNAALQGDHSLRFHTTDNDQLIAYTKSTPDRTNVILTIVNLDPHHTHSGWVTLSLAELGIDPDQPFQAHDLLSGARYFWQGPRNYVELDPRAVPAHILQLSRRVRREHDFEYFL